MDGSIDKYIGCMVGLAVGDALGTTLEFKPKGIIEAGVVPELTDMIGGGPFNLKPGQWTDDTTMALCLALSLIEKQGFDAADQMDKYWKWVKEGFMSSTGQMFDIGDTTSEALCRYQSTGNPFAGVPDPKKAGNGALMRLAPIPMVYIKDMENVKKHAILMSQTTHGAQDSLDACSDYAVRIAHALKGMSKDVVLDGLPDEYLTAPKEEIRASGYVKHTHQAALWAFKNSNTFEEGALKAVNLCEDADTTGAVYGQLAGAYYGFSEIPEKWRNAVYYLEMIKQISIGLYNLVDIVVV